MVGIITDIVSDAIVQHCMNCPLFMDNKCATPCMKVDMMFPSVLKSDYIKEWIRVSDVVIAIYAKPIGRI
jgi:hypothetical protein